MEIVLVSVVKCPDQVLLELKAAQKQDGRITTQKQQGQHPCFTRNTNQMETQNDVITEER